MLATFESRMQLVEVVDTGLAVAPTEINLSTVALREEIDQTNVEIFQDASVGSYLLGKSLNGDEILYKFRRCPAAYVARLTPK